jgi:flagellar basal body-associated protein FliL
MTRGARPSPLLSLLSLLSLLARVDAEEDEDEEEEEERRAKAMATALIVLFVVFLVCVVPPVAMVNFLKRRGRDVTEFLPERARAYVPRWARLDERESGYTELDANFAQNLDVDEL